MSSITFDTSSIVYIVLEVIIAVVSILGNAVVCYVVANSRKLHRKIMYAFVMSLAMADLSVGAVAIPLAILTKLGLPHNNPTLCLVMFSFIVIPTVISIFNLMTISIERYLAICRPTMHLSKLTTRRALLVIVLTWILATIVGLLPVLGWNDVGLQEDSFQYTQQRTTPEWDNARMNESMTSTTYRWIASETMTSEGIVPSLCIFVEAAVFYFKSNNTSSIVVMESCHQVMDENYLFFVFVACVLPPLLISAMLYFLIFLRVTTSRSPVSSSVLKINYHVNGIKTDKFQVPTRSNFTSDRDTEVCNSAGSLSTSTSHQILSNSSTDVISPAQQRVEKGQTLQRKKEIRVASSLGLIIIAFSVCWLPIHILNAVVRFDNTGLQIPIALFDVGILLSHANSAINFFLYSWRLKPFRKEMHNVFSKVKVCR